MKKTNIIQQMTNRNQYLQTLYEMLTLAENVFEFKNLPDIIDVGYVNRVLLQNGSIAFFYDDALDSVVALPYDTIGKLDIYGRPINIMARAQNGTYYKRLNKDEFVIMYDNSSRYPLYANIMQRAERIALIKKTEDINVFQQRTPRIWKVPQEQKVTFEHMINDIDAGMEQVAAYKSMDLDELSVVMSPAPYITDKLDEHLDKEWAEFYRLIGISSVTESKKERLITDEVNYSIGGNIASRFSRFTPRKQAVDLINKKWDLNIEVGYYDGEPTTEKIESEVDSYDLSMDVNDATYSR